MTKCSLAKKGEVNRNFFIVSERQRYVLRQNLSRSHYGSSSDPKFELAFLRNLESEGFPYRVPLALPTRNGRLFTKVQEHYYWLYRLIEGMVIERLDASHFDELARRIATYHLWIERSELDNRKPAADLFGRELTLSEMEGCRSEIPKRHRTNGRDTIFMEESERLIPMLRSLDENPYSNLSRYPIHRDIIPENLIWEENRIVGLIDFEHVSGTNEPTVKDIAVTLQFVCRNKNLKHQIDLELAKQFVRSYKKWHSISDQEVQLIPNLIVSGFIEDFVWAYWMLRNDAERARASAMKRSSDAAQWTYLNRERISRAILS